MSFPLLSTSATRPETSRRRRLHPSAYFYCALLLLGSAAQKAKGSYYDFSTSLLTAPAIFDNWTLTDYGGLPGSSGAGTSIAPDPSTIVLTGINDGSFVPGWTGLTIPALGAGLFQFDYSFSTLDTPHYEYAGYILGGTRTQLADTDGQSGSVSVPVLSGEIIGFYAGGDDQGGLPGTLAVTNFSAPVPEPATFPFLLMVGAGAACLLLRRPLRR